MSTIRPATVDDAPAMARVHVDTWRTAYPGIVPAEHLAKLSYERSQALWTEHLQEPDSQEKVFVVENVPGEVVAIASGGPVREAIAGFDGELYVLYVLESFQGMGFGKGLVKQVALALHGLGFQSMVIWVLKDNPACRFYERLGGQPVAEKVVTIGGKDLVDVAYGWDDLSGWLEG